MMKRFLAGLCVLAFLTAGSALADDKDKDKTEPKSTYAKPEAAFDGFVKAMKKNDLKAAHATLTPESGDMLLGQIIFQIQIGKQLAAAFDKEGKLAEAFKPIDEAMDKAGLTKEKVETGLKAVAEAKDDKKKTTEAITKMLAPVKDKGELLGKITAVITKLGGGKKAEVPELKLSGVKVDGDKATAKATAKVDDKEETTTFTFHKIKGSWYVELPDDFMKKGPRPPK